MDIDVVGLHERAKPRFSGRHPRLGERQAEYWMFRRGVPSCERQNAMLCYAKRWVMYRCYVDIQLVNGLTLMADALRVAGRKRRTHRRCSCVPSGQISHVSTLVGH